MIFFIVGVIIIISCTTAILFPSLFNKKKLREVDLNAENIQITLDRVDELTVSQHTLSGDVAEIEVELKASLLDDLDYSEKTVYQTSMSPGWGLAILILIPVLSVAIYWNIGSPQYIGLHSFAVAQDTTAQRHIIEQLLQQLEENIASNQPNSWRLAANAYMVIGNYTKAEIAYSKLHQLLGDTPDILIGWADAIIMANSNVYIPEAQEKINRALALDPQHIRALWIAGLGAKSLGDNQQALKHFQQLLPLVKHDPEARDQILEIIQAILQITQNNVNIEKKEDGDTITLITEINKSSQIKVSVTLAPSLVSHFKQTDTVFVIVKAVNGPSMPLVVSRHLVKELPLSIILDDSMSMLPQMQISSFTDVTVSARVSPSGDVTPQPEDFISEEIITKVAESEEILLIIQNKVN